MPLLRGTHRFKIIKTFAGHLPFLRTQQTLLLEHERGADERPRTDGQNDSNPVMKYKYIPLGLPKGPYGYARTIL